MNRLADMPWKDKVFVISTVAMSITCMMMNNPVGTLISYAVLGLWLADKVWEQLVRLNDKLVKIEKDKEALEKSLLPDEPYTSNIKYDVPSIPRLLSAIKLDNDLTLYDYVVEHSTSDNISLRLTQATEQILSSLSNYSINNGSQSTDNRRNQREGIN